jgi:hypothetical protein
VTLAVGHPGTPVAMQPRAAGGPRSPGPGARGPRGLLRGPGGELGAPVGAVGELAALADGRRGVEECGRHAKRAGAREARGPGGLGAKGGTFPGRARPGASIGGGAHHAPSPKVAGGEPSAGGGQI